MEKQSLIESFNNLEDAMHWSEINRPEYPSRPNKPLEPRNGTPEDYQKYATELIGYSEMLTNYNKLLAEYNKANAENDAVIQAFIWKNTGLDGDVPEQYRSKVWDMAYQLGHSSGYSEIHNYLSDLVDIFKI